MKEYVLWYDQETPYGNEDVKAKYETPNTSDDGWEKWSLPIGNSYMGANIFGRLDVERIQITENSLHKPGKTTYIDDKKYPEGGLNNFTELYIEFGHQFQNVTNYKRSLSLNDAVAKVSYEQNENRYYREYFTSYPDRVLAAKFTATQKGSLSFKIKQIIPYLGVTTFAKECGDKKGTVSYQNNQILMQGSMSGFSINFCSLLTLRSIDGNIISHEDCLEIKNATEAELFLTIGTNYKFDSQIFLESINSKKLDFSYDPFCEVKERHLNTIRNCYEEIRARHISDYQSLFCRVDFEISKEVPQIPTDQLLQSRNKDILYLCELFYQFGRYLLIASSRTGGYPANLQGTWNRYDSPPWTSGYWHNINVQMNYWPAFSSNLEETFSPYETLFLSYLPKLKKHAEDYIRSMCPENYNTSCEDYGWIIGTSGTPYSVSSGFNMETKEFFHSGPSTAAFTAQLFWEKYLYTMDMDYLRQVVYPIIEGASRMLANAVIKDGDTYLIKNSASPENIDLNTGRHYQTVGCAFDQQMMYENHRNVIEAASILGIHNDFIDLLKHQVDHLEPVLIGESGQIKEYREETYYSEIGDPFHRHISHLVGVYPLTIINSSHKEWMDAAKVTLNLRGDTSTGWAMAHRMNVWARLKDGERTFKLLQTLLKKGVLPNLWDTHPPFQIDGNFGATSAITEMLLQSHEGYIEIIPAIPGKWQTGHFKGLVARGAFVINASWENRSITSLDIVSKVGGELKLKISNLNKIEAILADDKEMSYQIQNDIIILQTEAQKKYQFQFR